jgi:hypothetical protein
VRDAPARPSPTSMVVRSVLTLTLPRCPDFSNALERQRGSWQVAAPAPPPEAATLSSRIFRRPQDEPSGAASLWG